MESKKVVLFIVEGINDKVSLGEIIRYLFKGTNIFFQITDGDITTNISTTSTNVLDKVYEQVKIAQKETHYEEDDIIMIVHLVDTDGAFIGENKVIFQDTENVIYSNENIKTKRVKNVKIRNKKKALLLSKLCAKKEINNIPYKVYYFSCNLEHVLHNIQNATKEEKEILADEFSDKFYLRADEFLDFINNPEFSIQLDYNQSWAFIKKDNNSLKRYTNFNIFFNDIKDIISKEEKKKD